MNLLTKWWRKWRDGVDRVKEVAGEQHDDVFIHSDLGCVQRPTETGTSDVTSLTSEAWASATLRVCQYDPSSAVVPADGQLPLKCDKQVLALARPLRLKHIDEASAFHIKLYLVLSLHCQKSSKYVIYSTLNIFHSSANTMSFSTDTIVILFPISCIEKYKLFSI